MTSVQLCVCMSTPVHVNVGAHGGQKRAAEPVHLLTAKIDFLIILLQKKNMTILIILPLNAFN